MILRRWCLPRRAVGSETTSDLLNARTRRILNDGSGDTLTIETEVDGAGVGGTALVPPRTYYENVKSYDKAVLGRSHLP